LTSFRRCYHNLIRDFLIDEGLCDAARATRLAGRFERYLLGCDWIETSDGVNFAKVPAPGGDRSDQTRQLAF